MFNLLRRSKNKSGKTSKNSASQQSVATSNSLSPVIATPIETSTPTAAATEASYEYYRKINECESIAGLPTARSPYACVTAKAQRAQIEELEDLEDLEEDENNEKQTTTKTTTAAATATGEIYFHSCRGDRACEEEKVNLAKTAAIFMPSVTPTSTRRGNSKSNSANKKANNKAFAFSESNVDRINKIVAVAALAPVRDEDDCTVAAVSQSSHNEQAEWQGHVHVPPIGKCENIEKIENISKQSANSSLQSETINNNNSNRSVAIGAEDAERFVPSAARRSYSNTVTVTSPAPTDTVINEVKYRNLGSSQAARKDSETKRQSRLSLTLGLNLTSRKSKSDLKTDADEQVKHSNDTINNIENDSEGGSEKAKQSTISKLFHKEGREKKLRPLQKSKEFLSDIFMARGRNHNRNRSHHQQQQQQQPPHSHPQSKSQPIHQSKPAPGNYAAVISNGDNHNNNRETPALSGNRSDHLITNQSPQSAHLETISDPSSISTNSYQITMPNNSSKNFSHSQRQFSGSGSDKERSQRSNSADQESNRRLSSENIEQCRQRALSEEPGNCRFLKNITSKGANGEVSLHGDHNDQEPISLNGKRNDEHHFIHETGIETDRLAETATSNFVAEDRCDRERNNAPKINNGDRVTIISNDANANAKRQWNDLTECDRDRVLHSATIPIVTTTTTTTTPITTTSINIERGARVCDVSSTFDESMGQTNAKPEVSHSRASTPREFRESIIADDSRVIDAAADAAKVVLPKITIVDYSNGEGGEAAAVNSSGGSSPIEGEVFYDFEHDKNINNNNNTNNSNKSSDDHVNITAVDESGDECDDGIEDDVFHDQIPTTVYSNKWPMRHNHTRLENVPEEEDEVDEDGDHDGHNLDNELDRNSNSIDSPERNPLKSTNTSDSNLSTSFPDSGIGDSQSSTHSGRYSHVDSDSTAYARSSTSHQRSPFSRDGNSTDCDETLLQYDDLDYVAEVEASSGLDPNERLVCIESISLPDVVVESTTATSGSNASASAIATSSGEHIININGATGNSMGNVHFIPIHVEGESNSGSRSTSPKRRSVDDSVIGSGAKAFSQMNGHHSKTSIEITEDASELNVNKMNGFHEDILAEKLKRELTEQKSHFNSQLVDAQKNVQNLQTKVSEMQTKIEKLEGELAAKAWNVERLQGELIAAHKDDEFVRSKLKILEDEKTSLRHKYSENEDEFKHKYEELEAQYKELENKYQQSRALASSLQAQLVAAQTEAEEWRNQVETIRAELEEQITVLKSALENSESERKICQDKWQKEFEILRTHNMDREETLMTDCEWQLRQMQRKSKDKVDKAVHGRQEAIDKAAKLENELEERNKEVKNLRIYQTEANSLRGVVTEQEHAIKSLMEQIENLKSDLQTANTSLEDQIEAVKRIKYHCDNALCDKEREVVNRINEVRHEAATFWEDKLYTEMTRLKNELESVYVDERREALDKLQEEHIEELRALTTRYTANEDELHVEFNELQDRFDRKSEEYLELREKSDNAILQTRMLLDRADRDYQNAMCREEERREALEESLHKEFQEEKSQMEEQFRERLNQVKEEFARELQTATQEMKAHHKKELEQQKAKLQAEREGALQELTERHRKRLAAAEEQIKETELRHQHDLKDLKDAYDEEKSSLDKRDISNANEIEQLHRKCRCLTNLFEEMRMRYERREPRPEDLREIAELRTRCDSQERDLFLLTDRLRDMQIQMSELQENGSNANTPPKKSIKKPPPKTIPTNCDVIYEENEERESPPPPPATPTTPTTINHFNGHEASDDDENEDDADEDDDDDEDDEDEDADDDSAEEDDQVFRNANTADPAIIINGKEITKNIDTINEDDESHMITAV